MKNRNIAKIVLLLAFNMSFAVITIKPSLMSLDDKNSNRIISVSNPNDYKSYISMEAEAFSCENDKFSCQGEEKRPYENLKDKLIFSTPKFILNPKQTKKIHVSWNGELPKQALHVIYYAKDHSEKAVTTMQSKAPQNDKITFNVNVITRQISHILTLAKGTIEEIPSISKEGENLNIKNNGSAVLLVKVLQHKCPKDDNTCAHVIKTEIVKSNSNKKYKFNPKYPVEIRYFYNNDWKIETVT